MTKEQLELFVGVIAGLEVAIVHTLNLLVGKGIASKDELASSFTATAEALPPDVRNRERIAMVLRHVAVGLQTSETQSSLADQVRKELN